MSLRRLTALCCALAALAAVILARVYWVGSDTAYAASAGRQTTQTTELPRARGNFLDRTGRPLTGTETTRYALCIPGDNSYSALLPCVPYQAQTLLYERRNTTSPFLIEIGQTAAPAGTLLLDEPRRTLPSPIAVHLLGYLDQENHGVTGLERAWDTVLAESYDQTAAVCQTTARGRLLGTAAPEIITEQQGTGAQVKLTLDADIQRLCEGIAQLTMPRGCILVMDTATGEILASVSMPEYDPGDVARSIRADDTSLVNRAFATFSVGSVFKVAAALAAYENGMDWFTHDCTGSIEVDGQTYRCALGKAHGTVNMRGALEQSCNCYFIALGQLLGGGAQLFGLDGVIVAAFILGITANETVVPIMIMAYSSLGTPQAELSAPALRELFTANGWNMTTAVCVLIFILFHSPCMTTLLTIKKETGSLKWTAVSFILPVLFGAVICAAINLIAHIFT